MAPPRPHAREKPAEGAAVFAVAREADAKAGERDKSDESDDDDENDDDDGGRRRRR